MTNRRLRLVPVIILMVLVLLFLLRLQVDILSQTPGAIADVPDSRQHMGMNLSPYKSGVELVPIDDDIVSDLENLGVKWMRFEFRAEGTPPDTTIPLDDYHLAVDNLTDRGVEVLGLIDYATLPWPKEEWSTTGYREEFVRLTSDLVGEFQDQVHAWEIWNEEDIGYGTDELGGETYLSPMDYAYLLGGDPTADESTQLWASKGVYAAIREQDSEATVLLGGLSNAWKGEDGRGAGNYLAELYQQLSLIGYEAGSWPFDVVGVHPYYGTELDPAVYLFDGGDYILHANLWTVMEANGDGDKRFWITEIGWNTNEVHWSCIFPSVSRASQAAYLYRSYEIFLSEPVSESDVLVDKVFWFMYQDTGIEVDPATCYRLDDPTADRSATDPYTRIMPPRVTPTPGPDGAREADLIEIDFWWGVVDGDYVPKPSYHIYRLVGQVDDTIYLPLVFRNSDSP